VVVFGCRRAKSTDGARATPDAVGAPASAARGAEVVVASRLWSAGEHAVEVGELPIPSGVLMVADAGTLADPVRMEVAPGTYRVRVVRNADKRVEAAALVAPSAAPVRWEELGHYPVDAGMSGFFDGAVFERVGRAPFKSNIYDDLIAKYLEPAEKNGRSGVLVSFEKDVFSACSSGEGDGLYPVLAGRDARGVVVVVVTDFYRLD
jgi:hypothetical protein